ncbi:MAG TPA: hypothetical protein VKV26_09520 [Dehalococcoidia bacterium]|nr:hypothetical protein [Dehalococcoidia bacterium]
MKRLRSLFSIALLCALAGVAGGLSLGYLLSRRGEWLVAQPWVMYAAVLLVVTGALTWLDVRRGRGVPLARSSGEGPTVIEEQQTRASVAEEPAARHGSDAGGVVE